MTEIALRRACPEEGGSFGKEKRNERWKNDGEGRLHRAGDGSLDFEAIVKRLAACGDEGWFVVEAEKDPTKAPPDMAGGRRAEAALGRLIDPREVARAVAFLASDESGLMTGSVVNFDQSVSAAYDSAPQPGQPL